MQIRLLKCWLSLFVCTVFFALGQKNQAFGQSSCGLNFTGPAGNVLTSFVELYPNYPNCNATFNTLVQVTNQPLPLGTYLTWCVDADVLIDPSQDYTVAGTVYTGQLFPTCDTNLNNELPPGHTPTSYVTPAVWQQVNYLLNHKVGNNFWAIQVAINQLVGGPAPSSSGYPAFDPALVQAMVSAATNNAAGWAPQCGDVLGAVYMIQQQAGITLTNPVQYLMIEVPYCPITFTTCPANLSLGCNPPSLPDGNITNVTAVSCCGHPVTISVTKSQATAGCSNWRYLVYTASDAYGNSASCTQTINWISDTNAPVLVAAPASSNLGCNPAAIPTDASVKALVSYAESCSAATVNVTHVDGGSPCAMTRVFLISASDACGNQSLTNAVTYTWTIDTNAPTLTVITGSTNLGCNATSLPTDASLAASVVATDNCAVVSTNITHVDSTNGSAVTRTFFIKVADACGNATTNSVSYNWVINHGPLIACTADVTINGTNASPSITGVPTVTDACGNPVSCSNTINYATNWVNLYCDQFSGADGSLNGRAPDSADMGGFKWTAGTSWWAMGNQATITNCTANAFLPFQPTPGVVYQVSADIECVGSPNTTSGSDWVALGFANGFNTGSAWQGVNNPVGWQLARNSGNTAVCGQTFQGPGTSGYINDRFYPTNLTHYSVILDTRPANPGAWTFTFYANGAVVTPSTAFGGCGPTITSVGLGMYATGGAAGHVKNFCVSFNAPSAVTNFGGCANLSYRDKVVSSPCAGKVQLARTWYAWDNQGYTNTCTQNIYEVLPLNPPTFTPCATNLCAPATLPTDASVKALVIAYSGLVSTNVTHLDSTNGCVITRIFTVTVTDSCGNVSPAATLVYTLSNPKPGVQVCVCGPANGTCSTAVTYTCNVTNTGNAAFASCSVGFLGQNFNCPALQPGQGCSFPVSYTFQVGDCGSFCSAAVASAVCATPCAPTCTGQSSCTTKVCGKPCCTVTVTCPSSVCCSAPWVNTCCITNSGTACWSACTLSICGKSVSCPALSPGQGCVIPVSCSSSACGTYTCQAVVNATCVNATSSTCSGSASCSTVVCAGSNGSIASGTYKIINRNSNLALEASGCCTSSGTQIDQFQYKAGSNQKWAVTYLGNGTYKIIGVQSGLALDDSASSTANSAKIQLWGYSGGDNQAWILTPTASGYYRISPQCAAGSCLDVVGWSTANSALVQLYGNNGGANQDWSFQAP